MKPYIKDLLIILLILLCFYVGCNWHKDHIVDPNEKIVYVKGETIIKVDTIYREKTIYKPVATLVYVGDSSLHVDCDSIREYTESLDDSSGLVVVESKVQGELLDQKISLQSYVTSTFRVDTLIITKTETVSKRIFAPTFGLRIDSVAVPNIGLMLSNKKGNIIYSGEVSTKKDVTLKVGINLNR